MRFNVVKYQDPATKTYPGSPSIVQMHDRGTRIACDPFPGGHTKFTIRYDPLSRFYLTPSNYNPDPAWEALDRNVLSLSASRDLRRWQLCKVLLADDTDLSPSDSMQSIGFQYTDWQFDGEDIIYLVHTAYNGAHNFHDANHITFHILSNFRPCCLWGNGGYLAATQSVQRRGTEQA